MLEGLEYLIWRIEAQYYESNKEMLSQGCIHEEKLDCNCISGLIINYAGYLLKQCVEEINPDVEFVSDAPSFYMKTFYKNKELFPLRIQDDMQEFYYGDKVCDKLKKTGIEARIPFSECKDEKELESLKEKAGAYAKQNTWALAMPQCYWVDFWIRFLEALRTADVKISKKAFLMMALFMFPGSTLKLIKREVKRGAFSQEELGDLIALLHEYMKFVARIESDEKFGFFSRFSRAFEESVNVNIAEFIEEMNSKVAEQVVYQSLMPAYRNSREELESKSRQMSQLLKALKGKDLSTEAEEQLCEMEQKLR